ncbi:hypothetical protein M0811_02512 [Anaeramoeba ignava]|uniref:Uncharacterized protein n=1 Tax=Anaeramoeba ignava TaxID=1746090 RepID=A0A9Q0LC53_ANAIG|nr:hypothetical protein M0811_02512 [Anaeramoeba ignava]
MSTGGDAIRLILKSKFLYEYFKKHFFEEFKNPLMIGDYGSGRNEEVPMFFSIWINEYFPEFSKNIETKEIKSYIYCIDLHQTRLLSLMNKLADASILSTSRMIFSKLEDLSTKAEILDTQIKLLKKEDMNDLDLEIEKSKRIPENYFDIGVLNNDMIGFLYQYYTENSKPSNLIKCLNEIRKSQKKDSLLITTGVGLLYKNIDYIKLLKEANFEFIELIDINIKDQDQLLVITKPEEFNLSKMSLLNHYSFAVFKAI